MTLPLLPGKREASVRFIQELLGARRDEYEAFRRRLSIGEERFWHHETVDRAVAILAFESEQPHLAWSELSQGEAPFTRWIRRNLRELHGLDLGQKRAPPELIAACSENVR